MAQPIPRRPHRHWGQHVTCCSQQSGSCPAPGQEPGWPRAGLPDVVGKLSQASTPSLQMLSHVGCLLHHEATDTHVNKPHESQKGKATVYFPSLSRSIHRQRHVQARYKQKLGRVSVPDPWPSQGTPPCPPAQATSQESPRPQIRASPGVSFSLTPKVMAQSSTGSAS